MIKTKDEEPNETIQGEEIEMPRKLRDRENFILNKNHQCPKCGYMWKDLELKGEIMKKYLVTIAIQDGERKYWDYFVKEGNNAEEVERYVGQGIKETSNFETEERFVSCLEISNDEINILNKFGIL